MGLLATIGKAVGLENRAELVKANIELRRQIAEIEAERNVALAAEDDEIRKLEDRISRVTRNRIDKPFVQRLAPLNARYREIEAKLTENPPAILADALQVIFHEIEEAKKLKNDRPVRFTSKSVDTRIEALKNKQTALRQLAHESLTEAELRKEISTIKNSSLPELEWK